jgi:hypothetical protein
MTGLPAPSIIRPAKRATIGADTAERIGHLALADQRRVAGILREDLAAAISA